MATTPKKAARKTAPKKTAKKPVTPIVDDKVETVPGPQTADAKPGLGLWKWALVIVVIIALGLGLNHYKKWHPRTGGVDHVPVAVETVKPTTFNSIRDVDSKKYRITLSRADGQIELRTGGSLSWRYNNPGNITFGDYAKSKGAIGSDPINHLAVFPTYDVGRKAAYDLLFVDESGLKNQSIEAGMKVWAPTKDGFDPTTYTKRLTTELKVKGDVRLKDLTEEQRQKALDVLATTDVFISGKITVFKDEADWKARGW